MSNHPRRAARPLRFALGFLICLITGASALAADGDRRVALIIGNSKYPSAPLKNPANDATAMAKKLKDLGFDVIVRMDVGQREMNRAIVSFGEKLTLGSVGLFYYAGHGMQARGRNYLVPVDAEITSEASVGSETVDVERVLEQLNNARLSMVILDACRNNPFERRFRSGTGSGLAQIDAPAGTLIAYATSPGKVALDGEGVNGTYTEALLRAIETPGLRVEDVFKQVRINVLKATANQQIPWESSSLTGDFLFKAAPPAASADNSIQARLDMQAKADAARAEAQAKEAAALREQMALLRAEIGKLRDVPAPSADRARNPDDQRKADAEAALLREQLASMNAEITRLRQAPPPPAASSAQQAHDAKQAEAAAAALRQQVASLNAELSKVRPVRQASPQDIAAWKAQLAKVEAARAKLTLSSALAALLDVTSDAEVAQLKDFERFVHARAYSSSLAMGVDGYGQLVWGASAGYPFAHAKAIATDLCAGAGGTNCRTVVTNGSFSADDYLAVSKALAVDPVASVRGALLKMVGQPARETPDPANNLPGYRNASRFTFASAR